MSNEKEKSLTMCWFGFYQPYATSIIHDPEQEISPKEIDTEDLIFIWDQYMKSDLLTELLGTPVPWSPAFLEGYSREWIKGENGIYKPRLIQKVMGKCLGAVILLSRVSEEQLEPLKDYYNKIGYVLKKIKVLVGDITRDILGFLPK